MMKPEHSNRSPATPTRRSVLAGGMAVATVAATGLQGCRAGAAGAPVATGAAVDPEAGVAAGSVAGSMAGSALEAGQAAFLQLSRALTGHPDLDGDTAGRIHQAMAQRSGDFAADSQRLAALAQGTASPQALLDGATSAGLRDTALAIVAAWYTGTVGSDSTGTVVAYRHALMYRPVSDAMAAPTYCPAGPAWWTHEPPPTGVPPPRPTAAPPAPTTGFPVQTGQPPEPPHTGSPAGRAVPKAQGPAPRQAASAVPG